MGSEGIEIYLYTALKFYLHQEGRQKSVGSEDVKTNLENLSAIVCKSLKMIRCEIV